MAKQMFDDDILAENFSALSRFSNDVVETLQSLTTIVERHEIRLQVVEKVASRPVVVKNSRILILTAMGVSFYAGYKYAQQQMEQRKLNQDYARERPAERAAEREEQLKRSKANHPAGSRIDDDALVVNGSNDPRPES